MVKLHPIATGPDRDNGSIIFIHGLDGDPFTTWGAVSPKKEGELFWPRWIADALPELAVYTLGYEARPTAWHGEAQPLLDRSKGVLDELLKYDALRRAPIALVCHSLGGLVVQEMLTSSRGDPRYGTLVDRTAGVVFLATPTGGSDHADALAALLEQVPGLDRSCPLVRDLRSIDSNAM